MKRKFANLQRIDNDEKITTENHHEFLYQLHHSLLLALKERDWLNTMQYRHAAEKLKKEFLDQRKLNKENCI